MNNQNQLKQDLKDVDRLISFYKPIPEIVFTVEFGIENGKMCPKRLAECYLGLPEKYREQGANNPLAQSLSGIENKYMAKLKLTIIPGAKLVDLNKPFQDIAAANFEEYNSSKYTSIKERVLAVLKDVRNLIKSRLYSNR